MTVRRYLSLYEDAADHCQLYRELLPCIMSFMDNHDFGTSCTACGNTQSKTVLCKDSLSLQQCLNCGTIFLGGYSDDFVPELYAYYEKYTKLRKEDVFDTITSARCQDLLEWFSRVGIGRKALDVGCGLGQFVEMANMNGWKAEGLELSKDAVGFARRQGLPVKELDFLSAEIKPNSYDLVTLFEVIEHVPNPLEFLCRAGEVVRPGGLVYLTTPSFASVDRFLLGKDWKIIHPEHLTYFTPHTLRVLVKKTRLFEVLHLETRNVSIAALRVLCCGLFPPITQIVDSHDELEKTCDTKRQTQDLRRRMNSSKFLGLVKRFANGLLNMTGLGASMVMLLRCAPRGTALCGELASKGSGVHRMTR